ncbi:MAG: hypothetical protein IIB54_16540 [Planctomycetes bacterium]|nr:hypothetical protein [Planctomycetota bacterium]
MASGVSRASVSPSYLDDCKPSSRGEGQARLAERAVNTGAGGDRVLARPVQDSRRPRLARASQVAALEPGQRQLALPLPIEQDTAGVELRPMTDWERMKADYETLSLSPNYHPMALLRPHLTEAMVASNMVESLADGTKSEVAGLVVCRQRPGTASGFVFLVLEDEFGLVNVVVKPQLYASQRDIVRSEPFVVVKGEIQRRDGVTNLIAESFTRIDVGGGISPPAHNFGHGNHGGRG